MKILVLGAGLVAKPAIDFFLRQNYTVTLVDMELEKAKKILENKANGTAMQLDVSQDENSLNGLIKDHDIVVLLLPPSFTATIAKFCIKHEKNLISTNYVDLETKNLDNQAKEHGITILCEIGIDPGIDHMIAKKFIDEIHKQGDKVLSFKSYCGGLPAPDFNDNPFGYKFSWSPRGVLLASKRPAIYLENNNIIRIAEEKIFSKEFTSQLLIDDKIGVLEVYANTDSLKYKDIYGIPEAKTIFRSTLRYQGWSETMYALQRLHYLSLDEFEANCTFAEFLAKMINSTSNDIIQATVDYLQIPKDNVIIKRLKWIGLFSEERIKTQNAKISPLDLLISMMLSKMTYKNQEKDILILVNEFITIDKSNKKTQTKISLIEYGDSLEYSAMAKTVSYPVVLCTELLLNGKIKHKGILTPIIKELYIPVLANLKNFGLEIKITKSEII